MIVKSADAFRENADIFFQYFNKNTIILNRFLFAKVLDFPSNIDLFNSTERKGASFICILYCCLLYFIIDFNVGQDILSDCGSMLFNSGIRSTDKIFGK